MWLRLLLLIGLLGTGAGCEDLPRDPEGTLERVRGGVLRVGAIHHEPWVRRIDGEPAGVEATLVRRFAEPLNARVHWTWGNEQTLMEALEHYELDLVIGGLTRASPWAKKVGFTSPFYTDRIMVGVPRALAPVADIAGMRVAVRPGEAAAAYLEKKNALPERLADPFQFNGPVAAPAWELERHGFVSTGIELHKAEQVMAVPPGENRWLRALERFLRAQRASVRELLQQQGSTP